MIQLPCIFAKAVFFAVCSQCKAEGPEELSVQDAHEAVIALGWDYRAVDPEGQMITIYTCKTCLEKFDNPRIYSTPLDPDCEISDADPGL